MKTHEFDGVYFHLKEWPRLGPKKLSIALSAEGCHREACLQQNNPVMLHVFAHINETGVKSLISCFSSGQETLSMQYLNRMRKP